MSKSPYCTSPLFLVSQSSSDVSPCVQKEPKLVRARQIPEWEEYDGEIARFAQSLVHDGKIKASAIAASVNELASIGTQKTDGEGEAPADTSAEDPAAVKHDAGDL